MIYYDSDFKNTAKDEVLDVFRIVREFFATKEFFIQEFTTKVVQIPAQKDEHSCGDFVCFYALHFVMKWNMHFDKVSLFIIKTLNILINWFLDL